MITFTVKLAPVQLGVLGRTVYTAVSGLEVVLVKVWLMEVCPKAWADPPVKPEPVGTVQVYVVPAGAIVEPPVTGLIVNVEPLQMVAVWLGISGVMFKTTTVVATTPGQRYASETDRV